MPFQQELKNQRQIFSRYIFLFSDYYYLVNKIILFQHSENCKITSDQRTYPTISECHLNGTNQQKLPFQQSKHLSGDYKSIETHNVPLQQATKDCSTSGDVISMHFCCEKNPSININQSIRVSRAKGVNAARSNLHFGGLGRKLKSSGKKLFLRQKSLVLNEKKLVQIEN